MVFTGPCRRYVIPYTGSEPYERYIRSQSGGSAPRRGCLQRQPSSLSAAPQAWRLLQFWPKTEQRTEYRFLYHSRNSGGHQSVTASRNCVNRSSPTHQRPARLVQ
eukprot:4358006-Pleurochrysis_carterae.AAC.2